MRRKATKGTKKRTRAVRLKQYCVFISYSTADSFIAHVIKERIEAIGAKTYLYEKDMEGGSIIINELIAAVDISDELVVLESPSTRNKPDWVIFEIGAARGQHKRVTPILNNVAAQKVGPTMDLNAVNLNDLGQFLRHLRARIQRGRRRKG